jgi:hypothetical protein
MRRFFPLVSKPEDRNMHVKQILTRCFSSVFNTMHRSRRAVFLRSIEALVAGHRLTLTDIARHWPDAMFVHAPLKALDRLLSNRHMQEHRLALQRTMARWLLRGQLPVVIVDWADLKGDGRWYLLRASVPVGGRTITLLDQLYPIAQQNTPKAQQEFLQLLKTVVGKNQALVIITDAGFRSDWCRAVLKMGWHFVGRLRNNTKLCQAGMTSWQVCNNLHPHATKKACDLGHYHIVQGHPLAVRLVMVKHTSRQRHGLNQDGSSQQDTDAKRARKRTQEPWLLHTSLSASQASASGVVNMYAKRMQIEEAFRDLKSSRFGVGLEHSQSRKQERLHILLLLQTLAEFVAWVTAITAKLTQRYEPVARQSKQRLKYSMQRLGRAWLLHPHPPWRCDELIGNLRQWQYPDNQ